MADDFEFTVFEDEPLTLESAVFQALGAASMCWDPRPSQQVFDSTRAKEIGDKLLEKIKEMTGAG